MQNDAKNRIMQTRKYQHTPLLDRAAGLGEIRANPLWDVVIIGGGATGLGTALDAASRGYKTLLLERHDFAKGTSSRSTKLVHGGVRYLAMGDVGLVYGALRERATIFKNAPHLAHSQSFIIPCYSFFGKMKYLIGLKLYDWLAGRHRIGKSSLLTKEETSKRLPGIRKSGLKGGVQYYDGQFDDSRFAINLAQTAAAHGASLVNYCEVTALLKSDSGTVSGLVCIDNETADAYHIQAKCVINATGVFVDQVLAMDTKNHHPIVRPSQGAHIVVDKSFLGQHDALMIPQTSDGRVLFGVPWHDYIVLGTTDTPIDHSDAEPEALDEEIQFILNTAATYLDHPPTRRDVKSIFAGLRPLAAPAKDDESTKEISRDHKLIVSQSGLITITGGKWTTYRKMAEDTIDRAIKAGLLSQKPCVSTTIPIHGHRQTQRSGHWKIYGSDADAIAELASDDAMLRQQLHPAFDHIVAEVVWAVRHEMARTVEDVLARRMRILFLDAEKSMEMAPPVARIMAAELGRDEQWVAGQVDDYSRIADKYRPRLHNTETTKQTSTPKYYEQ